MQHDEFYVHGVIDSPCYPNSSSFAAYLYPSVVPGEIQKKMADISKKLLTHIGFDNAAFNIDFFWDETKNTIKLVEVNPRVSMIYSALFHKVEGVSNHQIPLDLVLDCLPVIEKQDDRFNVAAVSYIPAISRSIPSI
jgi:biotin carboxylase